jgi:hypothetical protein
MMLSLLPKSLYQREVKSQQGGKSPYTMMRMCLALGYAFFERILSPRMRDVFVPGVIAAIEHGDTSVFPSLVAVSNVAELKEVKAFMTLLKTKPADTNDGSPSSVMRQFEEGVLLGHHSDAIVRIMVEVLYAPIANPDKFSADIQKIVRGMGQVPDKARLLESFNEGFFALFTQLLHCELIVHKYTRDGRDDTKRYGYNGIIRKPIGMMVVEHQTNPPNQPPSNAILSILYPGLDYDQEGLDINERETGVETEYLEQLSKLEEEGAAGPPEEQAPPAQQQLGVFEQKVVEFNDRWLKRLTEELKAREGGRHPDPDAIDRLNTELVEESKRLVEELRRENREGLVQHVLIPANLIPARPITPVCFLCQQPKPNNIPIPCGRCHCCKECLISYI